MLSFSPMWLHLGARISTMFWFVCILLSIYQCDACLDLLVRAFSEIFNPVIEIADSRRVHFHDVDELTHYYRRDKDGSLVLDEKKWLPPNLFRRRPNPNVKKNQNSFRSLFKQLDLSDARSRPADERDLLRRKLFENEPKLVKIEAKMYPLIVEGIESEAKAQYGRGYNAAAAAAPVAPSYHENFDEYDKPCHYRRRGGYVPGQRPLVDFFIRIMEVFQLTAKPTFAAPRARHRSRHFYCVEPA